MGVGPALIALFGVGIDPPQDLFEVGLDRLVALAGPVSHGLGVTDQDRAAPGLQRAFRLEGLNDPAGIGTADAEQGRGGGQGAEGGLGRVGEQGPVAQRLPGAALGDR